MPDIAWCNIKQLLRKKKSRLYSKNWYLLEAKRYFVENSFDFKIETIGIWTNQELIQLACDMMHKN